VPVITIADQLTAPSNGQSLRAHSEQLRVYSQELVNVAYDARCRANEVLVRSRAIRADRDAAAKVRAANRESRELVDA